MNTNAQRTKTITATPLAWLALISLGLIWGASFMGAKLALGAFGPMTVSALRLVLGAVLLTVFCYLQGKALPGFSTAADKRLWVFIFGMGLFSNAVPFTLLNWGQLYVTSGFAGISMSVVPLIILPMAFWLVPGETFSLFKLLGFLLGFAGVVLLIGPAELFSSTGSSWEPIARLACALAAMCYAIGGLITRLSPPVDALPFAAGGLLVGTVLMVPVALFFEGMPTSASPLALAGLVYLGVFPTAIATLLLVWVINTAGPTFLSQVNYQVPTWALVFGVVLLGEDMPSQFLLALGFILLGILVSRMRMPLKHIQ